MNYFLVALFLITTEYITNTLNPGLSRWWLTFFTRWWAIVLSISTLNLFELYEVNTLTYLYFITFVCSYAIGFISFSSGNSIKNNFYISRINQEYNFFVKSKFVKLITLLIVLVLSYYTLTYFSYIETAGISESRSARFNTGTIFNSAYEILLYDYIISSAVWILKFIISFGIVFSATKNIVWLLSLAACILYMSFGAGRNISIEIALITIILIFIKKYAKKLTKKGRETKNEYLNITIFLLALYVFSILATTFRMFDDGVSLKALIEANSILLEHAVIYATGSIRAFEYATINYEDLFGFKYGLFTLSGIDEVSSLFLRLIGFDILPYSIYWGPILGKEISIGKDQYFNALYSALFNFYFDFGVIGILIFGFLFGASCGKILNYAIKNGGIIPLFLASLFFAISILSNLTWKLSSGPFFILVIATIIISRNRSYRILIKNREALHNHRSHSD